MASGCAVAGGDLSRGGSANLLEQGSARFLINYGLDRGQADGLMPVTSENDLLAGFGASDQFCQLYFGCRDGYFHADPIPVMIRINLDHSMVQMNG